jgi:hypothetical protein
MYSSFIFFVYEDKRIAVAQYNIEALSLKGGFKMRQGLAPILLGTAVTAAGAMMRGIDMEKRGMRQEDMMPLVSAGILGFGLAHVLLGTINLSRHID